jgi:hypothetical protein
MMKGQISTGRVIQGAYQHGIDYFARHINVPSINVSFYLWYCPPLYFKYYDMELDIRYLSHSQLGYD